MPTYQRIPAAAASGNEAILPLRIIILPVVDAKLFRLTARHITVPTTVSYTHLTGVIDRSVDICPHFFSYNNEGNRGHGLSFIQVWRCTTISNLMINEQIRDKEVRLIEMCIRDSLFSIQKERQRIFLL